MDEKEKSLKLYEWFDANRDRIIAGHNGEQVLIHDYKIVGYYENDSAAMGISKEKKFSNGDYIIQDCITSDEELNMYSFGLVNFG